MDIKKSDYVIIGSGLAGLYSAMQASRYGTVSLLCKTVLIESNSYYAQGGVAAAVMPDDSPELHYEDTIRTGKGLSNPETVRILVEEGKERIEELINLGMPFDTNSSHKLSAGLEGGHSKRRVLHAGGDSTGKEIINFLLKNISSNPHITVYENIFVYDLITHNNACCGVYGFGKTNSATTAFLSNHTIIASGGLAGIYEKTTNPPVAVGDGIALAYRHGVEISNLEMLQFHPTCFFPKGGSGFLISEAVRGEGAHLINEAGERFMPAIDPMAELAPRDLVSISIYNQMKKFSTGNVYLKLDHIDSSLIKKRFSTIYKEVLKSGIDITKDPLPVAPAAHYTIGGIKTDSWGRTSMPHLYAVGEAASNGVHGANRLASNSLLECLVFGTRAVKSSFNTIVTRKTFSPPEREFRLDNSQRDNFEITRTYIGRLMNENAGIVKTGKGLNFLIEKLNEVAAEDESEYYSLRISMLKELSLLVARSALFREETRGVHIREDFPAANDRFKGETIIKNDSSINLYGLE